MTKDITKTNIDKILKWEKSWQCLGKKGSIKSIAHYLQLKEETTTNIENIYPLQNTFVLECFLWHPPITTSS